MASCCFFSQRLPFALQSLMYVLYSNLTKVVAKRRKFIDVMNKLDVIRHSVLIKILSSDARFTVFNDYTANETTTRNDSLIDKMPRELFKSMRRTCLGWMENYPCHGAHIMHTPKIATPGLYLHKSSLF